MNKRISLTDIECTIITARLWPLWGIFAAPLRLWQWTTQGSWCWKIDGRTREPLRFRFGIAWAMVKARYWVDPWSHPASETV
jgi:hypothetical protein